MEVNNLNIIIPILVIVGIFLLILGGIKIYKDSIINSIVDDIKKSELNHGKKK